MDQKGFSSKIQMQKRHFEKSQRNLALSKTTDYFYKNSLKSFVELCDKKEEFDQKEKEKFFDWKKKLTNEYISQYHILTQGWQTNKQEKIREDKGRYKSVQYQKKHILDD